MWGRGLGLVVWGRGLGVGVVVWGGVWGWWCGGGSGGGDARRGVAVSDVWSLQAVPASPGKKSALSMLCDLLSNLFDSSQ